MLGLFDGTSFNLKHNKVSAVIIFEDTRNKVDKNSHIKQQLDVLGHTIIRNKLFVGDYCNVANMRVSVDTKQNLQEVVGNVTKQHERFRNECVKAKEAGIQLIILISENEIESIEDVFKWYNPRLRVSKAATTGRTLAKIMLSFTARYNVKFEFSNKDNLGKRIVELLGG